VNTWLGKDRSTTQYANLKIRDISVSSDGHGGVFTTVICSLGRAQQPASTPSESTAPDI
jgi:hypothetical protein